MAAKQVDYSTAQLIDYLVAGGNISDLVGTNIQQSGVLGKLIADPRVLSALGQQVASSAGATYDPSQTYTSAALPFEAINNTVRQAYARRTPVETQIANLVFDAIDQGADPITTVASIDDETLQQFGVKTSDVANLIADLSKDAVKYVTAKGAQETAAQKQQYNAFLKQTGDTGTGTGALASRLGVPTLANLPNPNKAFGTTLGDIGQNPAVAQALMKINAGYGNTQYTPSAQDIAFAKQRSAGVTDPSARPAGAQQAINKVIDPTGKYGLLPTSILGNKMWGMTALNQVLNGALSDVVSTGAAGLGALEGVGFNPLAANARRTDFSKQDAAAQKKAYDYGLSISSGAYKQQQSNTQRELLLQRAAEIINERGQKMAKAGLTPFTVAAADLIPMLTQSKTKIKKK